MSTSTAPTEDMLAAAARVARFMQSRDDADLAGVFADATETGVTIIENFAPHIFTGPDAVARWARGFRDHASGLSDLQFRFGTAQDFSISDGRAFFTLPTRWSGRAAENGSEASRRFVERGGWAFVLVREEVAWRVAGYGWAVTSFRWLKPT